MKRFGALLGSVALLALAACGETNTPLAAITAADVNGAAIIASWATSASPDWSILGTGDFDADHRLDILWTNGTALVLRAVANIMLGRGADALKDLSGAAVAKRNDLALWRALAQAMPEVDLLELSVLPAQGGTLRLVVDHPDGVRAVYVNVAIRFQVMVMVT